MHVSSLCSPERGAWFGEWLLRFSLSGWSGLALSSEGLENGLSVLEPRGDEREEEKKPETDCRGSRLCVRTAD